MQTQGATKRDAAKPKRKAPLNDLADPSGAGHATAEQTHSEAKIHEPQCGSLTYVTTAIDADTLRESTHNWIERERVTGSVGGTPISTQDRAERGPTPVLFVALHACGSLTPNILRAFAVGARSGMTNAAAWTPRAAVIVGCCYNMLHPEGMFVLAVLTITPSVMQPRTDSNDADFPLSSELRSLSGPTVALSPSHLQLAAQVPSQWTRTEDTLRDAHLALRKIVWRALIQDVLDGEKKHLALEETTDGRPTTKRLGRLNDAAYADWATFAQRVQTKLGLPDGRLVRADRALERRIAVFHVLRCIVGPVIESLLLLDSTLR